MSTQSERDRFMARVADLRAGTPVWWSRPPFRDFVVRPKKHVLVGRRRKSLDDTVAVDRYKFVYATLCGYEYTYDELLFGLLVPTKGLPRVADRCLKCVGILDELKKAGETVADVINSTSTVLTLPDEVLGRPAPTADAVDRAEESATEGTTSTAETTDSADD